MKRDIVIVGVGGQGILTIAASIAKAAVAAGLSIKQSEVHGMAQRGGAVQAHLRISDEIIYSDLVPAGAADVILAVEPLEALRECRYLGPSGCVLANSTPVTNIGNYPDMEEILAEIRKLPRHVLIDADELAREAGSVRAMNMVMLGTASLVLGLPEAELLTVIRDMFERKGEKVVEINNRAFALGRDAARHQAAE